MVAIPSRHKSLVLLAGVIVLQVLLLAVQIKRDSQGRLIRAWTVGAISPFQRAGAHGVGSVRGIWNHYFALQNTSRENEQLRHENDALKLQMADYWTATAEGFFSRVSKEQTLVAVTEAAGAEVAKGMASMKKAELAMTAERAVKDRKWLPPIMRNE